MAGQINISKGTTHNIPSDGCRGYGFDYQGNPVIIKEDGTTEIIGSSGGGSSPSTSNIVANRGIGLASALPTDEVVGDVYVATDEFLVYTAITGGWNTTPLVKSQFITDTSTAVKKLYQYDGVAIITLVGDQVVVEFASQVEAEGNANESKSMNPLRTFQNWINNIRTYSINDLATTAKTIWGSINELANKLTFYISDADGGGFCSWDNPASTKWSITGTAPTATFNLLQGGYGRILGQRVRFEAQSIANLPTSYSLYFVCVNASGVISLQSSKDDAQFFYLFQLFVGVSGTYYVKRENHNFSFTQQVSNFLHQVFGTLVLGSGGNIAIATTTTQIKIVGTATFSDHGLESIIPDSGGSGVTWIQDFKNASNQWQLYTLSANIAPYYNNAGIVTALTAGRYGVVRCYVSGDDGNSNSNVRYVSIMHTAEFSNQNAALAAINSGTIADIDGLLVSVEITQLGFAIINSSGVVVQTVVSKKTTTSTTSGGTTGLANIAYTGNATDLTDTAPTGFTGTNQHDINTQFAAAIDLREQIFFDDIGVAAKVTRPYNFTVSAKTESGGTGTITTSADVAYPVPGATVTANDYLKVTASAVNTRVFLTLTRE